MRGHHFLDDWCDDGLDAAETLALLDYCGYAGAMATARGSTGKSATAAGRKKPAVAKRKTAARSTKAK
jgi:hypothetical protein